MTVFVYLSSSFLTASYNKKFSVHLLYVFCILLHVRSAKNKVKYLKLFSYRAEHAFQIFQGSLHNFRSVMAFASLNTEYYFIFQWMRGTVAAKIDFGAEKYIHYFLQ